MPEISETIGDFVADAGFVHPTLTPLKGDLSSRRYVRVATKDRTAILMILPEDDRLTLPKVIDTTARLRSAGLSAPEILAIDEDTGVALIEDFGDLHLAHLIRDGHDPATHLSLVIDCLARVRGVDVTGLPRPDAHEFAGWLDLIDDWLPGADRVAAGDLRAALVVHLTGLDRHARVLSLRDAHVENIIWLNDRPGISRVGLIDFQDAFAAHPLYDIASLLRDARIDIRDDVVDALLRREANRLGLDHDEARFAFDLLTFQRNLRIAAVFNRGAKRDGKTQHLVHLPRVTGHVVKAAGNPLLKDIAAILPHVLRAETASA